MNEKPKILNIVFYFSKPLKDSSSTTKMTRRKRIGEAVEESNDPFDCFGMAFGKIGIRKA